MAKPIVVLTGAGISAESGIETFRDAGGLWENHRIEEVATPEAFASNPVMVHRFYNARRRQLLSGSVQPNAAHEALVRLERQYNQAVTVVTQNVDDLHERAGSNSLIHMHGELLKSRCSACGHVSHCVDDLSVEEVCDNCAGVATMRPHIVWFGEMPFQMDAIARLLRECGTFISIGTSGNVYPAAGFAAEAANAGARTIELNLQMSDTPGSFDESRYGPATETVPKLVDELIGAG